MLLQERQALFRAAQWAIETRQKRVETIRTLAGSEEMYLLIIREIDRVEAQLVKARSLHTEATLTIVDWLTTLEYFQWCCAYCQLKPFQRLWHVIPPPHGGTTPDNCVPVCYSCRRLVQTKNTRVQSYLEIMKPRDEKQEGIYMAPSSEPRKLILLVENNWVISVVLTQMMMQKTGYRMAQMTDGVAALKFIKHIKPDLVILDEQLPDMSGLELYERFRTLHETQSMPVLLVGGSPPDVKMDDRHLVMMQKPLDLDEILKAIETLLA
jgi:CheY-like chemotaxis protein